MTVLSRKKEEVQRKREGVQRLLVTKMKEYRHW